MAKARQYPCPAGRYLQARTDLVTRQFGELLRGLRLPPYWREMIREQMLEVAKKQGLDVDWVEREKERLRLKRGRILKQHREGYIDDEEFEGEMAAVELALRAFEAPLVDGVSLEEVISAGERLPGMTALWDVATVEERRQIVTHLVKPEGLHYVVEVKEIAAITPTPEFLPVLRLLEGVIEYEEATGTLVTSQWRQRNRRATATLSPVLIHFHSPSSFLYQKLQQLLQQDQTRGSNLLLPPITNRHPGPAKPRYEIPSEEWPTVLRRVVENQEPLRKVADDYGVSHETVRRVVRAVSKQRASG